MTVHTLQAGMPEVELIPGMKLKLEAISPTAGTAVAGVTTSQWSIYGDDLSDADELFDFGPYVLVPGPTA